MVFSARRLCDDHDDDDDDGDDGSDDDKVLRPLTDAQWLPYFRREIFSENAVLVPDQARLVELGFQRLMLTVPLSVNYIGSSASGPELQNISSE